MFSSLLIANRGEIACRIIQTCRRLGVRTVAVFSDADRDGLHVRLADQAVHIGGPDARSSYLDADKVIAAALETGAQAIHPGYGFLSEREVLPDLCARHGLVWVGPSAAIIRAMGSKIEAKRIARDAGVEGVPGYDGDAQDEATLAREAVKVGFPLLIKASAGGGGKGMRLIEKAEGFASGLDMARQEALSAFGDDRVLLERFIRRPRHLEVQLAGDKHGGLVHLHDRECSIQRNYQKLVEEAPAPNLPSETRARLHDAAVRLGRGVGYDSLGTVEFILDADTGEGPFFLEMNTRLQVEHPVTEMVTGLDLVELQMRIAAGEPLPFDQEAVTVTGAAIEVRINAEDPARGYQPQTGQILLRRDPEGVRVDSGVDVGSWVSPYYDSLLAKLIGWGADRAQARLRLQRGLEGFVLLGVATNQAFLADVIAEPAFACGETTTRFLAESFPDGWAPRPVPDALFEQAAVVALKPAKGPGAWASLTGFRLVGKARTRARVGLGDDVREVAVAADPLHRLRRSPSPIKGEEVAAVDAAPYLLPPCGEGGPREAWWMGGRVHVVDGARALVFDVLTELDAAAKDASAKASGGGGDVTAPMPGLITAVPVAVGQVVAKGDPVVVMEAMKLILSIPAPSAGTISAVRCAPGETVPGGARLIDIAPEETV